MSSLRIARMDLERLERLGLTRTVGDGVGGAGVIFKSGRFGSDFLGSDFGQESRLLLEEVEGRSLKILA